MRHLITAMCVIILTVAPNPEAQLRINNEDPLLLHSPVPMPDLDFLDGGLHQVSVGLIIHKIFDVDMASMSFKTTVDLLLSWRDAHMRHGGDLRFVQDRLSLSKLWIPDIYFLTARPTSNDQSQAMVTIARDGTVTYSTTLHMKFHSQMDVEKFPFDEQKYIIELAIYGLNSQQLNISWFERHISPLNFANNFDTSNVVGQNIGRCDFRRTYSIDKSGAYSAEFACLSAEIHIKRPIAFYMLQNFLPTILIIVASWMGFWIDRRNTAARVTLHFVSLLTLTVHGAAMRMRLPAVADITTIDFLFAGSMLFVFCALLEFGIVHLLMHASQKYLDLAKGNDSVRRDSRIRHERLARNRLAIENGKEHGTNIALSGTYSDLLSDKFRRKGEYYSLTAIRVDLVCRVVFPSAFAVCIFLFIFFFIVL